MKIQWAFGLVAAACFTACENRSAAVDPEQNTSDATTASSPVLLREIATASGATVRFMNGAGGISIAVEGSIDDSAANKQLEKALGKAKNATEAWGVLDRPEAVPQAILDAEATSRLSSDGATAPSTASEATDDFTKASGSTAFAGRSLDLATDASWDWTADARWWNTTVLNGSCGWYQTVSATNMKWADYSRTGWEFVGSLMAASHTYEAVARAYIWKKGAWKQTNIDTLPPRRYIRYFHPTGNTKTSRRYTVHGSGGVYARTHLGIDWENQSPSETEGLGVACMP